jgi:putative transposase
LHAHIILTPKYRKRVITPRVQAAIEEKAREVCKRFDASLDAIDGEDDHIHLLVSYPPKVGLSTLVGALKTNTSKHIRSLGYPEVKRALWGDHFWSPSYCVISTGGANLDTVKAYIEGQKTATRKAGRPKTH